MAAAAGRYFNPRPREGGRRPPFSLFLDLLPFQSTPPRGGATIVVSSLRLLFCYFNPRPREGGRRSNPLTMNTPVKFQSTPPRGGATFSSLVRGLIARISIHAPARGGDSKDAQFYLRIFDKQVELLRFWGKMRGGCLRNPEKDRRFLGKSLANLPEISGHLDFAGA